MARLTQQRDTVWRVRSPCVPATLSPLSRLRKQSLCVCFAGLGSTLVFRIVQALPPCPEALGVQASDCVPPAARAAAWTPCSDGYGDAPEHARDVMHMRSEEC